MHHASAAQNLIKELKGWQDLTAGMLGIVAVGFGFLLTINAEARKNKKELAALKKALGTEIRRYALHAVSGAINLLEVRKQIVANTKGTGESCVLLNALERHAYFPPAFVFMGNTSRIGSLLDTPGIVEFYGSLENQRNNFARIRSQTDTLVAHFKVVPTILVPVVDYSVGDLMQIARSACPLFSTLRTFTSLDNHDDQFSKTVTHLISEWRKVVSKEDLDQIPGLQD